MWLTTVRTICFLRNYHPSPALRPHQIPDSIAPGNTCTHQHVCVCRARSSRLYSRSGAHLHVRVCREGAVQYRVQPLWRAVHEVVRIGQASGPRRHGIVQHLTAKSTKKHEAINLKTLHAWKLEGAWAQASRHRLEACCKTHKHMKACRI